MKDVEVHYLTKESFRSVLAANEYIDHLYCFKDNLREVIPALKAERYDYIIDLHKNIRSAKVKKALKAQSYVFPKLNLKKWLLVNLKIDLLPKISIVDRYMEAAKPLGVKNDSLGLDYFIDKAEDIRTKDIPMSHVAGYIACVIGGSYNTKKLPVENWKRLCEAINHPIILLGGKEDAEDGALIAAQDSVKIYNACGKFSLNESVSLVKYAKMVLTNDTGLMHAAAAYNKNIVSFWGNTVPELGMYPYYGNGGLGDNKSLIVENKELRCRPCSKIGYNKCPKGHFKCMRNLDMEYVSNYINQKLKTPNL
ncbi:MAG: glycosyltransferase family 9 protein [Flavipsychrobacter sp.]